MSDRPVVRIATSADLAATMIWLKADYTATNEGFWVNRHKIERAFDEGRLSVLDVAGDVVGLLDDTAPGPEIVEIRRDVRNRGYGRILAEYAVQAAFNRGNSVVETECAPATSVPFWRRMGFAIHPARFGPGGGIYAHKMLQRTHALTGGPRVPYRIDFFEEDKWYKGMVPFASYQGDSEIVEKGRLQLPERALCFAPDIPRLIDSIACVHVDGEQIYARRAKYAETLGARRDPSGYLFFDLITPQAAA